MKYLLETPLKGTIGLEKYETKIHWRNGVFITDEPEKLGGKDLGPDPYTLLLSSLVGCTLATLRMYIDHKELAVSEIEVQANMFYKIENKASVAYMERKIIFRELLDQGIEERLLRVAENCPISKLLKGNINISTELIKNESIVK
ncbi:OsmC family protein [Sphingobacterium gobiense]|uniref:Osmotically inducible protein OsmC n=1 Tax=Sphingobacterium gobiense TaxID=1382456 RepID=A0A2S9JV77_9SPHI|nr:OsmC family protein [Sphingobacterium gobiense]PRD57153.1 osmotically inducible protein OsmC [Sphingobacterium gobiense]